MTAARCITACLLAAPALAQAHGGSGLAAVALIVAGAWLAGILLLAKTLWRPWLTVPGDARGSVLGGIGAAAALLAVSLACLYLTGHVSTARPPRFGGLALRTMALASVLAWLLILVRNWRRLPVASLPRMQQALALAWPVVCLSAWQWDRTTAHHTPLFTTNQDLPLAALRPLRESEVGPRLLAETPAADTCVLRVMLPGQGPGGTLALATYGPGAPLQHASATLDDWLRTSASMVGRRGGPAAVSEWTGPALRAMQVRHVHLDAQRSADEWRAWRAWRTDVDAIHSARQRLAEQAQAARAEADRTADTESLRRAAELADAVAQPYATPPEPGDPLRRPVLNVRLTDELTCAAAAPHCSRLRGHLAADGSPVDVEERCSSAATAARWSAFRVKFFAAR